MKDSEATGHRQRQRERFLAAADGSRSDTRGHPGAAAHLRHPAAGRPTAGGAFDRALRKCLSSVLSADAGRIVPRRGHQNLDRDAAQADSFDRGAHPVRSEHWAL